MPNASRAARAPRKPAPVRSNAMLDLKLLREEPELVRAALARRGADRLLDDVLAADKERRELVHKADSRNQQRNEINSAIGKASDQERESLLGQARELKAEIEALEPKLRDANEQLEM